MSSYVDIFLIM